MANVQFVDAISEGSQLVGVLNQREECDKSLGNNPSRLKEWTKKPCRIVCTTIIMLLLTTLITLTKMTMDLIRDVMNNENLINIFEAHFKNNYNMSIMCNNSFIK